MVFTNRPRHNLYHRNRRARLHPHAHAQSRRHFRTEVAAAQKHSFDAPSGTHFKPLYDFYADFAPKLHGNQLGDPKKLAELTVDLVRGEGVAKGKEPPLFLPLGSDAFADTKEKAERTLKVLEEWEEVIKSTDG